MKQSDKRVRRLSKIDKEIIKMILKNKLGKEYLQNIVELGIPRTTFNRRLRYLKENYIINFYELNQKNLDFRRLDLLVSTTGEPRKIGKKLLELDQVIMVASRIGEQDVDLRVEAIIKDNKELVDLINMIKVLSGVKGVQWSEIVDIIGRKKSIPDSIIDRL